MVGRMPVHWRSKWFDFGVPQRDKKVYFFDISRVPSSGTLGLNFRRDFGEDVVFTTTIDLSEAFSSIAMQGFNDCRHAQVEVFVPEGQSDVSFEVTDMVWRLIESDQR